MLFLSGVSDVRKGHLGPVMGRKSIFKGRKLELVLDRVTLPGGGTAERELVLHPGAVVILPVVRPGVILLLRQFRHAVGEEIYELPAGTLEAGESPEVCAARELAEETGFRTRSLRKLTEFWSSPGILRERMHLFLAEDLERVQQKLDDDEVVTVGEFDLADALDMVRDGRIADAKTIAGVLYYARFEAQPS
jgi:ADP-ribose pyrophosphatase